MTISIIVFDFDGTLVDTNGIKREAFYALFPDDDIHREAVTAALDQMGESSRYQIIGNILDRAGQGNDTDREERVNLLAERYNDVVVPAAIAAASMSGAEEALERLYGRYTLYVSSGTPQGPLRKVVTGRGWDRYFAGVYGYPNAKSDTLRTIMERHKISPDAITVIGDGESDRASASAVGCTFHEAGAADSFLRMFEAISSPAIQQEQGDNYK